MKVDDLVATRVSMDRASREPIPGWGPYAGGEGMVDGGSQERPEDLLRALDVDEISMVLRQRAIEAFDRGEQVGARQALEQARRQREREVQRESSRWVEVALELVLREFGPVLSAAQRAADAVEKAPRARTTADQVRAVHVKASDLAGRLRVLRAQVAQDGINP